MLYFETKHPNEPDYISNEFFTNFEFGLHLHPHFEIMFVSKGLLRAKIGDSSYDIPAGSMAFIMSMQPHSFTTPHTSQCHVCVFSNTFVPDFYEKYRNKIAIMPIIEFPALCDILKDIASKGTCRYALASHFYNIISMLIKNSKFTDRNERLDSFVEASLAYIDKYYDKEPSLCALASILSYDKQYCSRLFNKTFGKSFPTMVNEYRMFKAGKLLAMDDMTITRVALLCGFSCIRSFNRNFLKTYGCTPSELKQGVTAVK